MWRGSGCSGAIRRPSSRPSPSSPRSSAPLPAGSCSARRSRRASPSRLRSWSLASAWSTGRDERLSEPNRRQPLFPLQHGVIDAPWTTAGEDEIEEHEAIENRPAAAVGGGKEGFRGVGDEIGKGHFAGHDERRPSGEQADQQKQASESFDDCCEDNEARKRRPWLRKAKEFSKSVLKEQQRGDDAQDAQRVGPPPVQIRE